MLFSNGGKEIPSKDKHVALPILELLREMTAPRCLRVKEWSNIRIA